MSHELTRAEATIGMLTTYSVRSIHTPEEVEENLTHSGVTVFIINSFCQVATDILHPAIRMYMPDDTFEKPDRILTVLAGHDLDATGILKQFMLEQIPDISYTSPCILFIKNKKLVYYMDKTFIQENTEKGLAADIANNVTDARFDLN